MASNGLGKIEAISKIVGFIAVGLGALGAVLQYNINSESEQRQKILAELESDIRISSVFSDFAQVAAGYGGWSEPQEQILKKELELIPDDFMAALLQHDPRRVGHLFAGTIIPQGVPLAKQVAAAEAVASLAIKYPILLEPALASLDASTIHLPQAKRAYNRLCAHYQIDRPLTTWGKDVTTYQDPLPDNLVTANPLESATNSDGPQAAQTDSEDR